MSTNSRRDFLTAAAAGLAGAALSPASEAISAQVGGTRLTPGPNPQGLIGDGRKRRILLRGGVVLTLDQRLGDFEKADVLIDGKLIANIAPNIPAGNAEVIDCAGTIVMPGFITTHHHQYETLQRSVISDGLLQGNWPQESYGSVVQNIWTVGRITDPMNPNNVLWDLGRVPYEPEDCYISQLVACLSEISEGVTTGTDTSQANHTPEHTDAAIKGLMDSGRRMVFDYSAGTNRSAEGFPFEFPGAMNDTTKGIGRIAKTYFSSKDQLVTLGFGGGGGPAFPGADYTGWQLGRSFGALINNHSVGNPMGIVTAAADPRNGTDWSDITFVHCTRWQDEPVAQIGSGTSGYPKPTQSRAWDIVRDRGAHASIAILIEMQMRHGMPPLQEALNHGILPSLSPDVDTNMTTDPFSLMRGAYCTAARPRQRPRVPGEQPRWNTRTAAGDVPSGDRDGHHRGCGGESYPGQSRHADRWQGGRHRRAQRAQHQHLAREQCPRHGRDDDESQARPRCPDCGEGRVLEGQTCRVGHRAAAAPD